MNGKDIIYNINKYMKWMEARILFSERINRGNDVLDM